jgi:hypothetical protein
MKTKLLVTLAAIALALLIPSGASAACASGQITLSNTNTTGFGVTVCLTLSGNTLTLNSISNTSGLTVVGVDALGYGTSATIVSDTDTSGVWAAKSGSSPFSIDGFGDFVSEITNPGGTGGAPSQPSFSWTFSASPGSDLVLHIRFSNGCSTFVSNRTTDSAAPDANCGVVPEPGTLALFGSGLVAIAGIIRRRLAA